MSPDFCPECEGFLDEGQTCLEHFYQMLYWENEYPGYGEVHHLLVLCFHLQHPSIYSQEGLEAGLGLLVNFVEEKKSPEEVRRLTRERVSSTRREWKITASVDSKGSYPSRVAWTMTAGDVVRGGPDGYVANVRAWADSVLAALRGAGILPGGLS